MDILIFSILTNFLYFCSGRLLSSNKKYDFQNQFYIYFIGVIFISFISLLLNFFTPLTPKINSIFYFLIFFSFSIKTKFIINKEHIKFLLISSFITFLLIIYSTVNRPDAGLYHLPFVSVINENKIIFGLSNIHARFGHISILQYLSAINNNYLFSENGITIPVASIVSFFYLYFFYDIWEVITKKKNINLDNFFSLFIIIYISFKIARYSDFGNDVVGHLCFFYLISYLLKANIKEIDFDKILLISVFAFINKLTLGLIFIAPIIIFILQNNFKIKKIFYTFFSLPALLLYLWLIKNIIISGCVIYPLRTTCIENLPWTNIKQTIDTNTETQAWSKGWPDRIDKKITIEKFNKNFNWINTWSKIHLKYILRIIIPYIIVLFLIVLYIQIKIKNIKIKTDENFKTRFFLCLIMSGIGTIYFFLAFPLYRFGYSYIITLISPCSILVTKKKLTFKENIPIFKFFFVICIAIIIVKQGIKIFDHDKNATWPNIYTLDRDGKIFPKTKIIIDKNFFYYLANKGDNLCMYSKSPCTLYPIKNVKYSIKKTYSFLLIN